MGKWLCRRSSALFAYTLCMFVSACGRPVERPVAVPDPPSLVTSNILRDDYAGSKKCDDCHGEIYDAWERSPMHRMTRLARGGTIEAPFDGATLRVGSDTATMEARDGRRYVTLVSTQDGRHVYRVTKVIGGRYREDYVGVDVTDASDPATGWGVERVLPVSFVFSTRSWRYKGYSVMVPERTGIRVQVAWSKACIPCHNTLPAITMLYDELLGPGAPSYQGRLGDDLLPRSRKWRVAPLDEAGLAYAIADEVVRIGGSAPNLSEPFPKVLRQAIEATRTHLGGGDLVEVGVGCETCHGGAAEHVADPAVLPSFELRSPLVRAVATNRDPSRAQWINRACIRCHTVLFSQYPWTWEGGQRSDALPGGSTTNSGEARDFALGGCANQMACTACHDPHGEDRRDAIAALSTPAGNKICASCHPTLATAEGLRAHTHHAPGAGSACIACHMPKKNMGLSYELTRYHRIGSPTDEARVLGDRPLECALCHQDKSVKQLVDAMERWWGKRYDRSKLSALYGDLDANVIGATLLKGKPHEQAVAIGVLGERGKKQDVSAIAPHLAHAYPLVRYYAKHAIEKLTGRPVPIDIEQPASEVQTRIQPWLTP
jgi:predicted CXXCH cytochrome family protein